MSRRPRPCSRNSKRTQQEQSFVLENLQQYSEDLTQTSHYLNVGLGSGHENVSVDANGIITIDQTAGTVNNVSVYYNTKNGLWEVVGCIEDNNRYVVRGLFNPMVPDEVAGTNTLEYPVNVSFVNAINPSDIALIAGTGRRESASGDPTWLPLMFSLGIDPVNATGFTVSGAANTASILQMKHFQVCADPGYSVFSIGDSICNAATNYYDNGGPFTNQGGNYSYFYGYDSDIMPKVAGYPGWRTDQLYTEIQNESGTYPVVIIEGGLNDAIAGIVTSTVMTNISNMITYAATTLAADRIIVLNVPPAHDRLADPVGLAVLDYNSNLIGEISGHTYASKCTHVDIHTPLRGATNNGVTGNSSFYHSGDIHPNHYGHRAIADAIISAVTLPSTIFTLPKYTKTEASCIFAP